MDSGNSGSVQSSSGGDNEEYDSRVDTISPFFNPSLSFGSISNHPQPPPPTPSPPPLFRHQPNTFFHASTQNLDTFTHSQPNPNANPLYNLDFVWSRESRSDPDYTVDLGDVTNTQSLLGQSQQGLFPSSSSPINPSPSVDRNDAGVGAGRATTSTPRSDQTNTTIKNSRKRTRASRRAPTTVLTTDTLNFRQMVQEFTGIPAPPFSALPYSRRLDFFDGGGCGSAVRSGRLENLRSLYPFGPSAQKFQASPFVSSSSSPPLFNSNNTNTTVTSITGPSNNALPSTSNKYQIRPDLAALPKQPQTMLNMQNQNLTSQTQTPITYPPTINAPFFSSKFQGSSGILSLDELGMSHEHVNANLSGFPSQGDSGDGGGQEHLGCFGSGGGSENGDDYKYKMNCSASTSEFHSETSLEKCFLEK